MRQKPPRVARGVRLDGAGFFGPLCEPGSYTVKLTKGDKTYTHTLRLVEDMTLPHSMEDRSLQRKTVREIMQLSEELALLTEQVWRSRDDARAMADSIKNGSLKKSLTSYADKMEKIRKELIATKEGSRSPVRSGCGRRPVNCTAAWPATWADPTQHRWKNSLTCDLN